MAETILEQQHRRSAQEQVFNILFEHDELTWKQIIFSLIDTEQMDPWDIDISLIAQKFLEMIKTLKQTDFRITGKIVLASALLLKMKSDKLVDEDIAALDQLINSSDEPIDLGVIDELPLEDGVLKSERPRLVPRLPQPRKRKMSVYDLIEALEQALETEARRPRKASPRLIARFTVPTKTHDMGEMLKEVYARINKHYKGKQAPTLRFTDLLPADCDRSDKVFTFIPLLHLDFQRKVDVLQEQHFGEISIALLQADAKFTEKEVKAAS